MDALQEEQEIEEALGEPLASLLDIHQWHEGMDLAALYEKMNQAVEESVAQAERTRGPMRRLLAERLRQQAGQGTAPKSAGLYRLTSADIAYVHDHLLFNGATECCDGTVVAHDSLLLTVAQIGVSLVAYQGSAGRWVQRLYRRDVRGKFADPMEEAIALLRRRDRSDSADAPDTRDPLSDLLRRGLMEYAERAVLVHHATAPWRMGHGNPISITLLLQFVADKVLQAGMEVTRQLVLEHRKFVYVASSPSDRLARTLGDALEPLEYAIIGTLEDRIKVDQLTMPRYGRFERMQELRRFFEELLPEIVYGVYRVAPQSPAHIFYAHKDHAHQAAAIAMGDSALQLHRGFPMLIDLADLVCRTTFDSASFAGTVSDAYAAAGQPFRYLGERETRGR